MQTPASLLRRTPAFLVDQAVVLVLVVVPALAAGVEFRRIVSPGQTRQVVFLILMGVAFVYHFSLELATGQTLGKSLFDLKVVTDDGAALGLWGSLGRNALRIVDGLGYWGVAVGIILLRGDGKRLGDVVGKTLVVDA